MKGSASSIVPAMWLWESKPEPLWFQPLRPSEEVPDNPEGGEPGPLAVSTNGHGGQERRQQRLHSQVRWEMGWEQSRVGFHGDTYLGFIMGWRAGVR